MQATRLVLLKHAEVIRFVFSKHADANGETSQKPAREHLPQGTHHKS